MDDFYKQKMYNELYFLLMEGKYVRTKTMAR